MKKNLPKIFFGAALALWFFVAATLTGLTEDVVRAESVVRLDKYWSDFFYHTRTDFWTAFYRVITSLGNWQIIIPALILITYFLIKKNKQRFVIPFIFTVVSAELVTFIGKLIVHRLRPEGAAIIEVDFSFPSGHATIAVAFFGYLAYIYLKTLRTKIKRLRVILGALFIILIIGFSRLYLGVHYVSDIAAGYLVGTLALIAGIVLTEWQFKSNQKLNLKSWRELKRVKR